MTLQRCREEGCTALISMRGKYCRPCQDLVRERAARERYYRIKAQQQVEKQYDKSL